MSTPTDLDPDAVRGERLARQRLVGEPYPDLESAVRHLTAVQAQEFDDVCRALARRVAGAPTAAEVADAIATGPLVRTHVLRPTWHVVHVDDVGWLLDLTAPRIHAQMRSQYRAAGFEDPRERARLVALVADVVASADEPPTRQEIGASLAARGVTISGQALGQLTAAAELDQEVVTGPRRGSWDTFVPFRSRVPEGPGPLDHDEAVARLAARYLAAHAPATAHDLAWWAGLTLTDARRGLAAAGAVDPVPAASARGTAHLLSLFDEYVIAYADRTLYAAPLGRGGTLDVWGGNVALVDGMVVGTWRARKPRRRADPTLVEVTLDRPLVPAERVLLEREADDLAALVPTPCEITWKESA